MKKVMVSLLLAVSSFTAWAGVVEVKQEASGSGSTPHKAIAEALLVAAQSVNGTIVTPRVDLTEEVNSVMTQNSWSYHGKTSPVFSVDAQTTGNVSRFQVLSVTGSGKSYKAKVVAYVSKFESVVNEGKKRRMAVMPFRVNDTNFGLHDGTDAESFVTNLSDQVGVCLADSNSLSLVSRDYLDEMYAENMFLLWDASPAEMARLKQKVGTDYILVGRVSDAHADNTSHYGANLNSDVVGINWRVIEVNTGKIAAAGKFKKRIMPQVSNMANGFGASTADAVAGGLCDDVLAGLKLRAPKAKDQPVASGMDDPNLSPGSSEKPIKWN